MTTTAQYAICVTRNYYGPRTTKTRLIDDATGEEWRGTRAAARAMIAELDEAIYYTAHNEAGRAEYTIVRAG
jgi:hypothetical protein